MASHELHSIIYLPGVDCELAIRNVIMGKPLDSYKLQLQVAHNIVLVKNTHEKYLNGNDDHNN